jgi:murein DD-endopeptidase MepM/ murein hydrolase activator NlpD
MNIFQLPFYGEAISEILSKDCYTPLFGAQKVRLIYNNDTSSYSIYLMCSENGRYRTLAWENNNAVSKQPTDSNNKLSVLQGSGCIITIKQKTGDHLALSVIDNNDGSETGNSLYSSGNIIFSTYNSTDTKQKWIFEPDIERFKEESYYSGLNLKYPLEPINKHITSDFGPRLKNSNNFGYDTEFYKLHDGLDISVEGNTDVCAPFTGTVKVVHSSADNDRGKFVIIESNSYKKYKSNAYICVILQHLNDINVVLNQVVNSNTIIGHAGGTGAGEGNVYDIHLHYSFFVYQDYSVTDNHHLLNKYECIHPLMFYPNYIDTNIVLQRNNIDLEILE